MKVLELNDVHIRYQKDKTDIDVLNGISFTIEENRTLALVGESGCGKTQTARCIMRLLKDNAQVQGRINWMGVDLLKLSEKELSYIRGKQITMIFQNPQAFLDPVFTIEKQLKECITLQHNYLKNDIQKNIRELLERVQIADIDRVMKAYPFQLSIGMCQRIMIAMAIASDAHLWIVDEATSALDVNVQADILALLKHLQKERKLSMLFITHDLRILPMMSDDIAIMLEGELIEIMKAEDVYKVNVVHHPYTDVLQNAMSFEEVETRFLANEKYIGKQGCVYASRCPHCQEICRSQKPIMRKVSKQHTIRCHFIG